MRRCSRCASCWLWQQLALPMRAAAADHRHAGRRCDVLSISSVQPPARLTFQPRRVSSDSSVSRWSPWISMRSSSTVPPEPQRFLSCVASAASSRVARPSPVITVTPLPLRPRVSRPTLTMPSPQLSPAFPCGRRNRERRADNSDSACRRPLNKQFDCCLPSLYLVAMRNLTRKITVGDLSTVIYDCQQFESPKTS